MYIIKNDITIIAANFQGVEEHEEGYWIYLSNGYTMEVGANEWERMMELYQRRYKTREVD